MKESILADALVCLKDFRAEVPGYRNEAFRDEVIQALEEALRTTNNKKNGKSGLEAAAKYILKNAKKGKNPALQGAWIGPNGKQYVCDGIMLVEIDDPIELEPLSDDVTRFNTEAVMSVKAEADMIVELPPLDHLTERITEEKVRAKAERMKRYKMVYCLGYGLSVDADNLQIAMKATGATHLRTRGRTNGKGSIIDACFLEGNGCTILLLPRVWPERNAGDCSCVRA